MEDLSFNTIKENISNRFKNDKKFKIASYVLSVALIVGLGYLSYYQFIFKPENEKSKTAYWKGLNYAVNDSIPEPAIKELNKTVKKYDGKDGAEIAKFILARQYMRKGKFQKAISVLEETDFSDTYLSCFKIGLTGDCYSDLKKYDKAYDSYLEAAELNEGNDFTSPRYLFKAAKCAEKLNNFKEASDLYKKIKASYRSFEKENIDKHIAKASKTKVK